MPENDGSQRPEQSSELVRRAKAGDRSAFDALIRRSQDRLTELVRARLGSELRAVEESTDVVQSALTAAVRDLAKFEYEGEGSFYRWLSTIVEHKIRHHVRDLHREKRRPDRVASPPDAHDPAGHEPTPSQAAVGHEMEDRYRRALEGLPTHERELLLLHLELGCTHDEISDALGIGSKEAVRKRIARALTKVEQAIHRTRQP